MGYLAGNTIVKALLREGLEMISNPIFDEKGNQTGEVITIYKEETYN